MPPATAKHFQKELKKLFEEAEKQRKKYIAVRSGDLHQAAQENFGAGETYGKAGRISTCCGVMYSNIICKYGDEILNLPDCDSGLGTLLVIRYKLPRPVS